MANQNITAEVAKIDERLSCAASAEVGGGGLVISINRLASHYPVTRLEPACWGVDPEVFFGPADSPAGRPQHVWERRALAVCAGCPVVAACLAEALEFPAVEQYGVVGGMTAGQRRAVLGASRRVPGRASRPRRARQDGFPALGRDGRPRRSSGPVRARGPRGPQ